MKQAVKKVETTKTSTPKETNVAKANKVDKVDALHTQKTNLFNRFLEASCDCV